MTAFEILLVEDNPGDIRLLKEALAKSNLSYTLNVISDGIDAMAFLQNIEAYVNAPRPDLILLDLNLPRKNGLEVLDEIKKDNNLASIPILLMSTLDELGMFNVDNHLADGFIRKPSEMSEFDQVIEVIQKFGFNASF